MRSKGAPFSPIPTWIASLSSHQCRMMPCSVNAYERALRSLQSRTQPSPPSSQMDRRMESDQFRRSWRLFPSEAGNWITASQAASSTVAVKGSEPLRRTTLSCGGAGRSGPVSNTRTAVGRGNEIVYSNPGYGESGPETSENNLFSPVGLPLRTKPESSRSITTIARDVVLSQPRAH